MKPQLAFSRRPALRCALSPCAHACAQTHRSPPRATLSGSPTGSEGGDSRRPSGLAPLQRLRKGCEKKKKAGGRGAAGRRRASSGALAAGAARQLLRSPPSRRVRSGVQPKAGARPAGLSGGPGGAQAGARGPERAQCSLSGAPAWWRGGGREGGKKAGRAGLGGGAGALRPRGRARWSIAWPRAAVLSRRARCSLPSSGPETEGDRPAAAQALFNSRATAKGRGKRRRRGRGRGEGGLGIAELVAVPPEVSE